MTKFRLGFAWFLLIGSVIGWPVAAKTFAKDEPQFILFLSFLAVFIEGFNGVQIAADRRQSDNQE